MNPSCTAPTVENIDPIADVWVAQGPTAFLPATLNAAYKLSNYFTTVNHWAGMP